MDTVSNFIDTALGLFSGSSLPLGLMLLILILGVRWFCVSRGLKDPKDKATGIYRDQLRDTTFVGTYHRLLERWFLNPLTRWFGDLGELRPAAPDGWAVDLFGIQPWTAKSYDKLLQLALFYPIWAVLLVWFAGHEGGIASLVLLPAAGWGDRAAAILGIVLSGFFAVNTMRIQGWRNLGSFAADGFFEGAIAVAFFIAGAVACAAAIAGAGTGADAKIFAGAFVGALVGAVAVAEAIEKLLGKASNTRAAMFIWFGFTLLMLGVIGATSHYLLPLAENEQDFQIAIALLIFIGLLPLLNALWDWVSLGVSRGLLAAIRLRVQWGWVPLSWGLADFLLAFVSLAGLVAMVTAAVATVNALALSGDATPAVDLPAFFTALRTEPDHPRFYWVYFMFLSTLIPTLVHLLIVGASMAQCLADWSPLRPWRETAAAEMDNDSVVRFNAALYLTLVPMSGLVIPVGLLWGLYQALLAHDGWLGHRIIDWAEWITEGVMRLA